MESSHFIYLCLLTALALYLVSQDVSSSSITHFPGRRFMVEFKTSTPKYEYYRVQYELDYLAPEENLPTIVVGNPSFLDASMDNISCKWRDRVNVDEGMPRSTIKESSMMLTYSSSGESSDDLVYHIDYHGVTTHPTPKHPKP